MEVAMLCDNLHCLPDEGGLMDQDPYWIDRLVLVYEAKAEKQELERKRTANRKG